MNDNAQAATASTLPETAERSEPLSGGQPRIVVGLDGSGASWCALRFAAEEARVRHGILHLVAAYDISSMTYGYAGGLNIGFDAVAMENGMRSAAEAHLKDAADTVATLAPGAPVHVQTTVAQGRPSQVLLDAADGATLLVVGARGAGAVTRMMIGSTSTEVVHYARLPVTVVPADEDGS